MLNFLRQQFYKSRQVMVSFQGTGSRVTVHEFGQFIQDRVARRLYFSAWIYKLLTERAIHVTKCAVDVWAQFGSCSDDRLRWIDGAGCDLESDARRPGTEKSHRNADCVL